MTLQDRRLCAARRIWVRPSVFANVRQSSRVTGTTYRHLDSPCRPHQTSTPPARNVCVETIGTTVFETLFLVLNITLRWTRPSSKRFSACCTPEFGTTGVTLFGTLFRVLNITVHEALYARYGQSIRVLAGDTACGPPSSAIAF